MHVPSTGVWWCCCPAGKKRRLTLIECGNDINSMIDIGKIADLVCWVCVHVCIHTMRVRVCCMCVCACVYTYHACACVVCVCVCACVNSSLVNQTVLIYQPLICDIMHGWMGRVVQETKLMLCSCTVCWVWIVKMYMWIYSCVYVVYKHAHM